ncbi:hypothetical protein [Nostoc sp. KVJ20]|nr:hypothetical protein [Nostoc sp. KVJ20]
MKPVHRILDFGFCGAALRTGFPPQATAPRRILDFRLEIRDWGLVIGGY